jgi:hypothetical protein
MLILDDIDTDALAITFYEHRVSRSVSIARQTRRPVSHFGGRARGDWV